MIMKQLGKLEKIEDLRSIWKHEAKDFTPWLAEEDYNQANNGVYAKSMPTSDAWIGKSIKGNA